ncbi:hypothetical protein CD33_00210 [Ureibacillus sinduriensis BLB-1 = JCM 15800]|uniref:Uncharacterized protein n=1 Tax=Ureibacillus sinduriensis BLB-1 = JCM 15800 TaxID=1384057 RepID=A0A0A3IZ45_9BACL|nr:hypothetical protein CD33_00210 [Ureibacillus sinduriensis BLB-1 = JCM 15800]
MKSSKSKFNRAIIKKPVRMKSLTGFCFFQYDIGLTIIGKIIKKPKTKRQPKRKYMILEKGEKFELLFLILKVKTNYHL